MWSAWLTHSLWIQSREISLFMKSGYFFDTVLTQLCDQDSMRRSLYRCLPKHLITGGKFLSLWGHQIGLCIRRSCQRMSPSGSSRVLDWISKENCYYTTESTSAPQVNINSSWWLTFYPLLKSWICSLKLWEDFSENEIFYWMMESSSGGKMAEFFFYQIYLQN